MKISETIAIPKKRYTSVNKYPMANNPFGRIAVPATNTQL